MARKGENIYKRKDGRWEGRYIKSRSSTGKANYGYVYAKSYREVKAKLISQSSCTSNSVTVDPEISSDQFEQVAMEWFQAICPKVKESTSNKYRNLLSSYILPVFGSKQLRDITHEFIETQCNFFLVSGGLKENGLSSKTVSDILSLIRNVLQFATRNGKAISCDARSIQIKRQTKEMRVLSRAEQEKLCQYLYSNLDSCNIGILVCLFTGLRVGEICALRWEDGVNPKFCVTAKLWCKIEQKCFKAGAAQAAAAFSTKITALRGNVKGGGVSLRSSRLLTFRLQPVSPACGRQRTQPTVRELCSSPAAFRSTSS